MKWLALVLTLFIALPVYSQSVGGRWFPLHDSGLDTLTGVATDSTLEVVSLKKRIHFGRYSVEMVPKAVLIVTQFTDVALGEGVTEREGFGDSRYGLYDGFSATPGTLATSPGAVDVYTTVDILTNPGDTFKYSLMQYPSALNTDSLSVRRYIFGIY